MFYCYLMSVMWKFKLCACIQNVINVNERENGFKFQWVACNTTLRQNITFYLTYYISVKGYK